MCIFLLKRLLEWHVSMEIWVFNIFSLKRVKALKKSYTGNVYSIESNSLKGTFLLPWTLPLDTQIGLYTAYRVVLLCQNILHKLVEMSERCVGLWERASLLLFCILCPRVDPKVGSGVDSNAGGSEKEEECL